MGKSIRVGRIWGIPLQLHVSWFLVFCLLTGAMALVQLPAAYPDWPRLVYPAVAVPTSLLFFGSVLFHELGHSRIALRHRIGVRATTLFALGGIAQMEFLPRSPAAQFRIALAGPAASVALSTLFGLLGHLGRTWSHLAEPALWRARINLTIAIFNLLPGIPLDGGWVLHAIAWRLRGSYHRAMQLALRSGSVLASSMMGLGVFVVMWSQSLSGVSLLLVGTFLLLFSSTDPALLTLERLVQDMTVAQVMHREMPRVVGRVPLQLVAVAGILRDNGFCLVVGRDDRPQGMLTEQQIPQIPRPRRAKVLVEQPMIPLENVPVVGPDDELSAVVRQMHETGASQAQVLEDGQLLGCPAPQCDPAPRAALCPTRDGMKGLSGALMKGDKSMREKTEIDEQPESAE